MAEKIDYLSKRIATWPTLRISGNTRALFNRPTSCGIPRMYLVYLVGASCDVSRYVFHGSILRFAGRLSGVTRADRFILWFYQKTLVNHRYTLSDNPLQCAVYTFPSVKPCQLCLDIRSPMYRRWRNFHFKNNSCKKFSS